MSVPVSLYGPQVLKDIWTSAPHTSDTNNKTSVCSRSQMNTIFNKDTNLLPPKWVVLPKAGSSDHYTLFKWGAHCAQSKHPWWSLPAEKPWAHPDRTPPAPHSMERERTCKERMPIPSSCQHYRLQRSIKNHQAKKEKGSHKSSTKINREKCPWYKHEIYFTRF